MPEISFTRIENLSSLGTPDLLCYNKKGTFFTVELKVTKSNSVRLSPHQISFHIRHPLNTFILVSSERDKTEKLYEGSRCLQLVACGLKLVPLCEGLEACRLTLETLEAWGLLLEAWREWPLIGFPMFGSAYLMRRRGHVSVYHMQHSGRFYPNTPCSLDTCCLAQLLDMSSFQLLRWRYKARMSAGYRRL